MFKIKESLLEKFTQLVTGSQAQLAFSWGRVGGCNGGCTGSCGSNCYGHCSGSCAGDCSGSCHRHSR